MTRRVGNHASHLPRRSSWRTRAAALLLIWMIGGGLAVAPQAVDDAIRSVVSDGLTPGRHATAAVADLAMRHVDKWTRTEEAAEVGRLSAELDAWRRRCIHLQLQHAELLHRSGETTGRASSPFQATSGAPLLIPELLEANVIGAARDPLRIRISKILDRGTVTGVAVDDIVLAGDMSHLDQGRTSGVAADMPVYAGRTVLGRIQQVGRWTSTVEHMSDPDFRGFAQIVRDSPQGPVLGAEGVLAGNGDGTCRLELIDVTEPVSVGDHVYTVAGPSGNGPRLSYGRIIAADYAAGASHWFITVESESRSEPLESVQILRESLNPVRLAEHEQPTTPFGGGLTSRPQ